MTVLTGQRVGIIADQNQSCIGNKSGDAFDHLNTGLQRVNRHHQIADAQFRIVLCDQLGELDFVTGSQGRPHTVAADDDQNLADNRLLLVHSQLCSLPMMLAFCEPDWTVQLARIQGTSRSLTAQNKL